jgi:AraC family transcriptional regulator
MLKRAQVKNNVGNDLYSVEIYNDRDLFANFNPNKEFEKWAAVRVREFDSVPDGMETLIIPEGLYAVFPYKGKASEASDTYRYIFTEWIPNSDYELDNRPHFALMGEKYKNEDPDSEEELWIPII